MNCINPGSEWIEAILLDMAASHPHLSAEEEATIKTRLFFIMASADALPCDAEKIARRFRQARAGH